MQDPLVSARQKIARAQHHIQDLNTRITQFLIRNSYRVIVEADSEPGYTVHKLTLPEPIPFSDYSLIIGDAIANLRAALDHMVYACVVLEGNANPRYRTCNFPFGKSAADFKHAVGGCTSVHADIRACLRGWQPKTIFRLKLESRLAPS